MANFRFWPRLSVLAFLALVMAGTGNHFASNLQPEAGEHRFVSQYRPTAEQRTLWHRQVQQALEETKGGEYYKPLDIYADFPGIDHPELKSIGEVDVLESSPVVGQVSHQLR